AHQARQRSVREGAVRGRPLPWRRVRGRVPHAERPERNEIGRALLRRLGASQPTWPSAGCERPDRARLRSPRVMRSTIAVWVAYKLDAMEGRVLAGYRRLLVRPIEMRRGARRNEVAGARFRLRSSGSRWVS